MINTSSSSSALLSNLTVLPSSVHSAPPAPRSETSPTAPHTPDAAHAANSDGGFARAIKQALAQRANKPASTPVRTASAAAAAGNSTAALSSTKKAGTKTAVAADIEAGGPVPDSAATGPGLAQRPPAVEPAAASGATNAAEAQACNSDTLLQGSQPWLATPDAAAAAAASAAANAASLVSAAGIMTADNSGDAASGASTRLPGRPSLADTAAAFGNPGAARAMAEAAAAETPSAAKPGDTDPGRATPLPRPQPLDQAAEASALQRPPLDAPAGRQTAWSLAAQTDTGASSTRTATSSTAQARRSAADAAADSASATTPAPLQDSRTPADAGHPAGGHAQGHDRRNTSAARDAADRNSGKTAVSPSARNTATAGQTEDENGTTRAAGRTGTGSVAGSSPAAAAAGLGADPPAAAVATATTVGGAAAPASAADSSTAINTPVTSPGFAAEAGYRLAVMVRDGVTSAQLQLNPTDMGPVTVQIVVEGQTAQVHLAAAQADTRQALDAAMPQLASNLRDAGLTLTGGGVFDQTSPQQGRAPETGAGNDSGGRQGRANDGREAPLHTAAEGPRTARSSGAQRRGVVDLIA